MTWSHVRRLSGSNPNVLKYVFERADAVAESVLYQFPTYAERTVVCCSTQSGCPVGCRFCGAGDYFVRSLTAEEIVAQPLHLFADHGIDPNACARVQIMFMSMGEPLLNLRALNPAIRDLHARFPRAALLVSTSGPRVDYAPMRDIAREVPTVGLQFSIHETTDVRRNALIPFAQKLTLAEIAAEGERWHAASGRRPFFNYCAHEGNSSDDDARRLRELFDPEIWEATISVVCERNECAIVARERQRSLAETFEERLHQGGFRTRVFDPAGQDDIGGGCGQLWFVQEWMRQHPQLARPSIGHSLPVVHAPNDRGE